MSDVMIWRCPNGHGLGIVCKDGHKISRLSLYRHATDMSDDHPADVDIIAVIESAENIKCDICHRTKIWAPNQAAFERLMSRNRVLIH